jgi:hypothetical protein
MTNVTFERQLELFFHTNKHIKISGQLTAVKSNLQLKLSILWTFVSIYPLIQL